MVMQSQTQGTQGARIVGKGSATAEGPGPDVMAADTLDGNRVLSSDGEDIGKIKDIMLDACAQGVSRTRCFRAAASSASATSCSPFRGARSRSDTEQKCFVLEHAGRAREKRAGVRQGPLAVDGGRDMGHVRSPVLRQRALLGPRPVSICAMTPASAIFRPARRTRPKPVA